MGIFEQNDHKAEAKNRKAELRKHLAEFKAAATMGDMKAAMEKLLKEAFSELKE